MNKILKWILILILIYICGGTTLFVWNMASCCGCTIEPLFKSCEQSEIVYKYDVKATLDNPLFISREVQLKKGKEKLLNVGYYNVHQFELKNVKLALSECMSQDGTIRLFYDDIENIWNAINDEDNWSLFDKKLKSINKIREY